MSHDRPIPPEDNIRAAGKRSSVQRVPKPPCVKVLPHEHLRARVLRPDALHVAQARAGGNPISQRSPSSATAREHDHLGANATVLKHRARLAKRLGTCIRSEQRHQNFRAATGTGGGPLNGLLSTALGGDPLIGSAFALNRETRDGGILSLWSRSAQVTLQRGGGNAVAQRRHATERQPEQTTLADAAVAGQRENRGAGEVARANVHRGTPGRSPLQGERTSSRRSPDGPMVCRRGNLQAAAQEPPASLFRTPTRP